MSDRPPPILPTSTPVRGVEAAGAEEDRAILLAEETVRVEARAVVTGRVRVSTLTHEHEELVGQDLSREDVEVKRVPVDREVERAPQVRQEGDVTIIPVLEEVLVVETRLVLKEEIHITRTRSAERVETPVLLRRQEAVVEHLGPDEVDPAADPAHPARDAVPSTGREPL